MAHKFLILIGNKLTEYSEYEDIPEVFDHVIQFLPEIPEEPHTHDQHDEIEKWNDKLQELMKRERENAGRNKIG
jgi:hypothetical protein